MNPHGWLSALIRASLEGGALLLLIWSITRLWPRMPAAARCGLWWLGALRMLMGLVPVPAIPVVWQPAWAPAGPAPMIELTSAMAGAAATPVVSAAPGPPANIVPAVIIALWLAGAGVSLFILLRRMLSLRRSWCGARLFEDPRVARWQGEWAVVLGRARVPEVRIGDTRAPVAFGALRPGLLLPADSARLSDDALRMVFAHEMSHLRRGDPLLGWVPAAAELVFWFHPLVRLAAREYLAAREQVCDADALRATGVSPRDYGALLLDFGVVRMSGVPGAASCASRGSRDLNRRLDMLSRTLRVPAVHRLGAAVVTLAVLALAFTPIRFVAAHESKESSAKSAEDKREIEKKHESRYKAELEKRETDKARASKKERSPIAYLVKISGREGTRGAVDMTDIKSAGRLDDENRTAVYFRIGEDMWISHDEEVVEEVVTALRPEEALENRQRGVEARQQVYEQEQMKLEVQREEIERRKAELEARMAALEERLGDRRASGRPTDDQMAEQASIEDQMQALWESERDLRRLYERLARNIRSTYASDKVTRAEQDKVHAMVLEDVATIARRAVEEGRAKRFVP